MGFEEAIPPIPNRQKEIEGLDRLRASWLSQPFYKYYMNESLRIPKIKFGRQLNTVYGELMLNMAFYGFILLPVAIISKRLFVARGNIPTTKLPDYYNKHRSDIEIKRQLHRNFAVPFWILGTVFLSYISTDFSPVMDPQYDYVHKTDRMI